MPPEKRAHFLWLQGRFRRRLERQARIARACSLRPHLVLLMLLSIRISRGRRCPDALVLDLQPYMASPARSRGAQRDPVDLLESRKKSCKILLLFVSPPS